MTTSEQHIVDGIGSFDELGAILDAMDPPSLFLVTGTASFDQPAIAAGLAPILDRYRWERFSDFAVNPCIEDVELGVDQLRALGTPAVLSIGGGSVLDMAKLVRFFAAVEPSAREYFAAGTKPSGDERMGPLLAAPTTSGTGSESTQFATVYVDGIKHSLDSPNCRPDVAILDGRLTEQLPPSITAETGMDALSQATESYWNVGSTDDSRQLALEAIGLLISNVEGAVNSPNEERRSAMALGANLAGRAINITRTTAAHAVSYPMTSRFGVPHGQAVGVTLPEFFVFNAEVTDADCADPRGADYVRQTIQTLCEALGYSSASAARDGILAMMERIGLKTRLSDLGIAPADHAVIIAEGFNPQRVRNNPRVLDEGQLAAVLTSIA